MTRTAKVIEPPAKPPGGAAKAPAEEFEACLSPQLSGLRKRALQLARNRTDADDLLQETVLRAWRFWVHFQTGSNLRGWLHRILLNTFRSRYRSARREREVISLAHAAHDLLAKPTFEPGSLRDALSDEVAHSLSALPDDFRAALWAVAVDGLSYREAAELLGCPIGTVMSRLHRARHALQPVLLHYSHA
jgi:RNA polymerase sigma-70 factor (ECF subfamily)